MAIEEAVRAKIEQKATPFSDVGNIALEHARAYPCIAQLSVCIHNDLRASGNRHSVDARDKRSRLIAITDPGCVGFARRPAVADVDILTSTRQVIASQVAVALENAEAYEEIARLKERLEDETRFYREEFDCLPNNSDIIGKSNIIQDVLIQIKKVSPTDSSVLIVGETGVGKELVAKALHRQSNRRDGPFIPVNCAALDPGLIASELFGHEKGAFTGASRLRRGRFELADGGTLFLDDIDTLPSEIQAKILRTLQEKEFERVGADKTISSNFRLLAATNQNLEEMIEKGLFRRDLYFRLKVFPIHIPPLRERKKDIPLLALHFLDQLNNKFGKKIKGLKKHHINKLLDYEWIGNVRELKHIMERAVILSEGENLELPDLIPARRNEIPDDNIMTMKDMERKHVLKALKQCGGRVSGKGGAAEILDIKPTTLYARIRKLEIHKKLT